MIIFRMKFTFVIALVVSLMLSAQDSAGQELDQLTKFKLCGALSSSMEIQKPCHLLNVDSKFSFPAKKVSGKSCKSGKCLPSQYPSKSDMLNNWFQRYQDGEKAYFKPLWVPRGSIPKLAEKAGVDLGDFQVGNPQERIYLCWGYYLVRKRIEKYDPERRSHQELLPLAVQLPTVEPSDSESLQTDTLPKREYDSTDFGGSTKPYTWEARIHTALPLQRYIGYEECLADLRVLEPADTYCIDGMRGFDGGQTNGNHENLPAYTQFIDRCPHNLACVYSGKKCRPPIGRHLGFEWHCTMEDQTYTECVGKDSSFSALNANNGFGGGVPAECVVQAQKRGLSVDESWQAELIDQGNEVREKVAVNTFPMRGRKLHDYPPVSGDSSETVTRYNYAPTEPPTFLGYYVTQFGRSAKARARFFDNAELGVRLLGAIVPIAGTYHDAYLCDDWGGLDCWAELGINAGSDIAGVITLGSSKLVSSPIKVGSKLYKTGIVLEYLTPVAEGSYAFYLGSKGEYEDAAIRALGAASTVSLGLLTHHFDGSSSLTYLGDPKKKDCANCASSVRRLFNIAGNKREKFKICNALTGLPEELGKEGHTAKAFLVRNSDGRLRVHRVRKPNAETSEIEIEEVSFPVLQKALNEGREQDKRLMVEYFGEKVFHSTDEQFAEYNGKVAQEFQALLGPPEHCGFWVSGGDANLMIKDPATRRKVHEQLIEVRERLAEVEMFGQKDWIPYDFHSNNYFVAIDGPEKGRLLITDIGTAYSKEYLDPAALQDAQSKFGSELHRWSQSAPEISKEIIDIAQ